MSKRLIASLALAGDLVVPATAGAETRPVVCGPVWVSGGHMGPGHSVKVRVKSWQLAPHVHRNIPCRIVLRDAKRIVRHGTFPQRSGPWMYEGDGRWRDGRSARRPSSWIQYYGGHGSVLRIYFLASIGGLDG